MGGNTVLPTEADKQKYNEVVMFNKTKFNIPSSGDNITYVATATWYKQGMKMMNEFEVIFAGMSVDKLNKRINKYTFPEDNMNKMTIQHWRYNKIIKTECFRLDTVNYYPEDKWVSSIGN